MKFNFDKAAKEKLKKLINDLKVAFVSEAYVMTLINKIPASHFLLLQRIIRYPNIDSVNNDTLLMFCGAFNFVFVAGDYGYHKNQNVAINALNDFIYDLKNKK